MAIVGDCPLFTDFPLTSASRGRFVQLYRGTRVSAMGGCLTEPCPGLPAPWLVAIGMPLAALAVRSIVRARH